MFHPFPSFAAVATAALLLAPLSLHAQPLGDPASPALTRTDFNRLAAAAGYPLSWREDTVNPGQLDPDELVVLGAWPERERWIRDGKPTADFAAAWRAAVELRRREAVRAELAQGRPTPVETSFVERSEEDRALMEHFARIAGQIDDLYEVQAGSAPLRSKLSKDDAASRALFDRNHGPWCEAPQTQGDAFCNAIPGFPKRGGGASYPDGVEVDTAFCEALGAEPNAEALQSPFTVVRKNAAGSGYQAVPYHEVYRKWVDPIAKELLAATRIIKSPEEAPLRAYLEAAAAAFRSDDWEAADEAWSAMAGSTSKWYVRLGPDETYWEPCQIKAGYHLSLALLDPGALEWKRRLEPLKHDMEGQLSELAGADVYAARDVGFELPEFIRIVTNAGDSRAAIGATVGQSLPNFGKVATESRGRTVVMVNLYADVDSMADSRAKDALLLDEPAMAHRDDGNTAMQFSILLHEAMHNFGPGGAQKVDGKESEAIFGGPLSAILEELKAELGAVYFLPYLHEKGFLTDLEVAQGYISVVSWCFGHVSRGLWTADGRPKTYSHVAAILLGELLAGEALVWDETIGAGTGDAGRFRVDMDAIPPAVQALTREVVPIKATGDAAAGRDLDDRHTSADALAKLRAEIITERLLRFPKASFTYAVRR